MEYKINQEIIDVVPELKSEKFIEPSQPALAPGVWLEQSVNQNSFTNTVNIWNLEGYQFRNDNK